MKLKILLVVIMLCLAALSSSYGQSIIKTKFEQQMVDYEADVVRCYNELQKFLYQDDRNLAEMVAFENLLSIYVDRILEIFSTMERLAGSSLETYRGVAARALIFRSLTYLERSKILQKTLKKQLMTIKMRLNFTQKGLLFPS